MKIEELTEMVVDFRERRDWAQYHHPKELASALSIEVFKTAEEVKEMVKEPEFRDKVGAELADSLFLLLLLAHESGVDLPQAFRKKLDILEQRYPEDQARGRNDKWTVYQDS